MDGPDDVEGVVREFEKAVYYSYSSNTTPFLAAGVISLREKCLHHAWGLLGGLPVLEKTEE